MLQHDGMFFVGILVFIFILWVAAGGPTRPLSWAGPFLNAPYGLSTGSSFYLPSALGIGNYDGSDGDGGDATGSDGGTIANPSQYYGAVSFDGDPTNAEETIANAEYVTLTNTGSDDQPIDISGWKLVSETTGNYATIGTGVQVPIQGQVNKQADILLNSSDSAYINTGISPLGYSFKENECTGYLEQSQNFIPDISMSCPDLTDTYESLYGTPDEDYTQAFKDPQCYDYISSLDQCEQVTSLPLDENNNLFSQNCQNFVTKYSNYNACVAQYATKDDFPGDTWHIYLGRTLQLWNQPHDKIDLVDREGKVVDYLAY